MANYTLDELVMRRPANGRGVEIQPVFTLDEHELDSFVTVDSGYFLAVELALPAGVGDGIWGTSKWGESQWASPDWVDVTGYVESIAWERGGAPNERCDIGQLDVVLQNPNGEFSPNSPNKIAPDEFLGAGTLMRVGVYQTTTTDILTEQGAWWPQITAFSAEWNEVRSPQNGYSHVVITGLETASWLSRVDDFAVSPTGADHTVVQRVGALCTAAGFPMLVVAGSTPSTPFQATTMAGNRLAEIYQTVDSVDCEFRSTKQGRVVVLPKAYDMQRIRDAQGDTTRIVLMEDVDPDQDLGGEIGNYLYFAWDDGTFTVVNNDDLVTNVVNLAAAGGTQYTYDDGASISRFQRRTHTRNDLIYKADQEPAASEYLADRILARGTATYRPGTCLISGARGWDYTMMLMNLEVGYYFDWMYLKDSEKETLFYGTTVANMRHTVKPLAYGVDWQADIEFGVSTNYDWEYF